MFLFSSVKKTGHTIKRSVRAFHLAHSLSELFKIYEQAGGPTAQVESAINAAMDRCLTESGEPKSRVQGRLYTLLRAKDMHRYVMEEPALMPVKLKLLEHVLFYRGLEERWAAIRETLLSAIDTICGVSISGVAGNYECYKRQASECSSGLGRLLVTTALLNFDGDEEQPPTNLRIRFQKRRFPEHNWELDGPSTSGAAEDAALAWRPENPLCRWEYLATDLLHALYRKQTPGSATGALATREIAALEDAAGHDAVTSPAANSYPRMRIDSAESEIYCALGRGGDASARTDQMELFPLHPKTFLPELQRQVHRVHGAEGVRLFALLFERLGRSTRGGFLSLALADIAGLPQGRPPTAAKLQQRAKKLWAILQYIAELKLTRIYSGDALSTCRQSNIITILEVTGPHQAGKPGQPNSAAVTDKAAVPSHARLLVDPVFHTHTKGALDLPYRDLPEPLLEAAPKDHPYALGLLIYLRQAWAEDWEIHQGVIQRSTRRIFQDAGFWLKDSARYRSIEAMKRDLAYLKEQDWLGAWRMTRSASRDALDDMYRLEAPNRKGATHSRPAPGRGESSVSA